MKPFYLIRKIGPPTKVLCGDGWREFYHYGTFKECAKVYRTPHGAKRTAGPLKGEIEVVRFDWDSVKETHIETRIWHRIALNLVNV